MRSKMKIKIKKKKKNFTMIDNEVIYDHTISLKSKGMCLILNSFPNDWQFHEEYLQKFTKDKRTAIANALKELELARYLYREQLRKKGKFANKMWIVSDTVLTDEDIIEICADCDINHKKRKFVANHNAKEKKKKNRKKKFYDFVNKLKDNAQKYPNMSIEFEGKIYCFINKNDQFLLTDMQSGIVYSKVEAERLYQKMAKSVDLKISRNTNVS